MPNFLTRATQEPVQKNYRVFWYKYPPLNVIRKFTVVYGENETNNGRYRKQWKLLYVTEK